MKNLYAKKFNGIVTNILAEGHLQILISSDNLFIIGIVDKINCIVPKLEDLQSLMGKQIEFKIKRQDALVSYLIEII